MIICILHMAFLRGVAAFLATLKHCKTPIVRIFISLQFCTRFSVKLLQILTVFISEFAIFIHRMASRLNYTPLRTADLPYYYTYSCQGLREFTKQIFMHVCYLNLSSLVVTGVVLDFLKGLREGSKSKHPFAALYRACKFRVFGDASQSLTTQLLNKRHAVKGKLRAILEGLRKIFKSRLFENQFESNFMLKLQYNFV